MKIEIVNSNDKDQIIDLLAQGKPKDYKVCKQKIWEWQYTGSNELDNADKGVLIKDTKGLAGFGGLMPTRIKYNDLIINSSWYVDAIVHPNARGQGIGSKLVEDIVNRSSLVVSLGISRVQSFIMLKKGFHAHNDIEQFFFINKPTRAKDYLKVFAQYISKLTKSISNTKSVLKFNVSVISASEAPTEIDTLWESCKNQYKKTIVRDVEYIVWKYAKHPLAKYKMILIREDDNLKAVGVFRYGSDKSRFLDYIGPAEAESYKRTILQTFSKECQGSYMFECTTSDKQFQNLLGSLGFRRYKIQPRFFVYSGLKDDQNPESDWFVMGGDSDNDLGEFQQFE